MYQPSELEVLENSLVVLEGQYKLYGEAKDKWRHARRKRERDAGLSSMCAHAKAMELVLQNPYIFSLIKNEGPFPFESFWKYADSNMPEYIEMIKARIAQIEK